MKKHIEIKLKATSLKKGFGFAVYKFAIENHLTGSLSYISDNTSLIKIEGAVTSITACVGWCIQCIDSYGICEINIKPEAVKHYDQFIIINTLNNLK